MCTCNSWVGCVGTDQAIAIVTVVCTCAFKCSGPRFHFYLHSMISIQEPWRRTTDWTGQWEWLEPTTLSWALIVERFPALWHRPRYTQNSTDEMLVASPLAVHVHVVLLVCYTHFSSLVPRVSPVNVQQMTFAPIVNGSKEISLYPYWKYGLYMYIRGRPSGRGYTLHVALHLLHLHVAVASLHPSHWMIRLRRSWRQSWRDF